MENGESRLHREAVPLVERFLAGDRAAFDGLLGLFQRPVYSFVLRTLRDPDDALELCQEIFLRVYTGLANWRPGGSVSGWVFRIATNLLRDQLRSVKRRQRLQLLPIVEEALPAAGTPGDGLFCREVMGVVTAVLPDLPDNQREVFSLYYFQGLSVRETAYALELTTANVKVLLHRARKALLKDGRIRALKEAVHEL